MRLVMGNENTLELTSDRPDVTVKPVLAILSADMLAALAAAEAAAASATAAAAAAESSETDAETAETAAQAAQVAAEAAAAAAEAVGSTADGVIAGVLADTGSDSRTVLDGILDALTAADVGAATPADVDAAIAAVKGAPPAWLDTIEKLSTAIGDDAAFSTTVANALLGKVPTSRLVNPGTGLTGGGDLSADRTLTVDFGTTAAKVAAGNRGLPAGGTVGQLLGKASAADNDVGWFDPATGGGGLIGSTVYSAADKTVSTIAFSDFDAVNLAVTFTAPASGAVIVRLTGRHTSGTAGNASWGLREGVATVASSVIAVGGSENGTKSYALKVTGLTPGNPYTYKWAGAHANGDGGGGTLTLANTTTKAVMEVLSA